jgi:diguanylate cyclase (GGDEF)-like protein/PAS domain S-box-containing protein
MDTLSNKIAMSHLPLRAAGFVALVCAVIVALTAMWEWSARQAALTEAQVDMGNLARSLTQHAEDSFDLLDASIMGIVSRLETENESNVLAKLQGLLVARKETSQPLHAIAICDENGDWLISSGSLGPNLRERSFFKYHKASLSHDAFLGPTVRSYITNDWITTISRRFNHQDGSFAGVVVASVDARYFGDFYGQFDLGKTGAVSLMSTDGTVAARRPDNGLIGRNISHRPLFKGIGDRKSGAYDFLAVLDSQPRLGFLQRSSRYPFLIVASKARDEVLAEWRADAICRTLIVLGLVSLIAFIGVQLVRLLSKGRSLAMALASKEASFRVLAEGSSDMVTRIGMDERIQYASPSSASVVGWSGEQLIGQSALAGVSAEDLPHVRNVVDSLKRGAIEDARITYRTSHPEKLEIWVESTFRIARKETGGIDGMVAITRDVSEQKDLESRLETLAAEDGLTGVANRRRFDERLSEEWGRAYRDDAYLALLMIDLDHFKNYNDEHGHLAGDECLRAVAKILAAEALRSSDLAARFGGEEFALLLPNTDAAGCARIGERIRRALRVARIEHGSNLPSGFVTASLGGAACRPGNGRSAGPDWLVEAADRALYAAKAGGRDRVVMSGEVVTLLPTISIAG